ncbi:unnamed protein product [Cuscuta europaea]|uniref:Response regulatory domain-containing protein n=1 Tax=Cuscuta europaea TaxID=41803 RepID=A0A9P1EF49_CUSEU|nr:unnamed protein product [Cuscuta europaea]
MGMSGAESQFHVLAVDDSVVDRKLVERLFKTNSCQVTAVDSGSKALEFLGLHEHDEHTSPAQPSVVHQEMGVNLIITDYCMPGMTGYDLLKKIKESSSLKNIPVVIMSSENVPSRISRCLEEGAEEFFLKPVRLSDVNKLKPHMMKTKSKDPEKEHDEQQSQEPPTTQQPLLQQQEDVTSQCAKMDVELRDPEPQEEAEKEQSTLMVDNKRKAEEKILSPERTKPTYNGLAAVLTCDVMMLL